MPLSTVLMIIFFTLYSLAALGIFTAPSIIMGIVAAAVAAALVFRK